MLLLVDMEGAIKSGLLRGDRQASQAADSLVEAFEACDGDIELEPLQSAND